MMSKLISDAMNKKLNEQVINEFGASHAYLQMACAFDSMNLKIMAKRFLEQADEEHEHAMKFVNFIQDVGGTVVLEAIPKPTGDYSKPKTIIKEALNSELRVTQQINDLMKLADDERDYASRSFLQWFVDEQVEEVASMQYLLDITEIARDMMQVEARVRHEMADEKS